MPHELAIRNRLHIPKVHDKANHTFLYYFLDAKTGSPSVPRGSSTVP